MPESALIETHNWLMPNGRHKGERITRIPVSYLKWMVNSRHTHAAYAEAELKRRGTVTPELDVSGHAIDAASLRLRRVWHEMALPGEGLHAWLCRVAAAALADGEKDGDVRYYAGIKFVFLFDGIWPVLKTVMPRKDPQ